MVAYSGPHLLKKTFIHEAKERVRQGGAWGETFVPKQRVVGVLADADARMVNLANARSQTVSHQLQTWGSPIAKSGDRFKLEGPPHDRFFYVQTYETGGADRLTMYATMERLT